MTDDFKQLLAAIGRCLIAIAGEDAQAQAAPEQKPAPVAQKPKPEPQQPEPAPMKGKRAPMPRKEKTCIVCGAAYMTGAPQKALLCPHCRILRTNSDANFMRAFAAAKQRLEEPATEPQPAPVPDGKIRCERMHATIPAAMCGTREECRGKPLCPHLPGGREC